MLQTTRLLRMEDLLRRVLAAACCWYAAVMYWLGWQMPTSGHAEAWVAAGLGIMVAEFLAIHSSFLIGEVAASGVATRALLRWLLPGYAVLALGIALAFEQSQVWLLMIALMLTRILDVWRPVKAEQRGYMRRRAVASVPLYVLLAFATAILAIPPGGLTPELVEQLWPDRGNGLWETEPQRVFVFGMTYFALLGLIEIQSPSAVWLDDPARRSDRTP